MVSRAGSFEKRTRVVVQTARAAIVTLTTATSAGVSKEQTKGL
jgi:hypothetical protein